MRKDAEKQAMTDIFEFNYTQAEMGASENGESGANYSRAMYSMQYMNTTLNYSPVQGQENVFEIVYENNFVVKPNALDNPKATDLKVTKEYKTGVLVRKEGENYVSKDLKQ